MTTRGRHRGIRAAAILGAILTSIVALVLPLTAGPAHASNVPYVVVMGDSYTANFPDILFDPSGCQKSETSWPKQLQRRTGRPMINVSCSGTDLAGGSYNAFDQAQLARKRGGFNQNTRAVLIQLGFNSFGGGPGLFERTSGTFPTLTGANYARQIKPLVTYIRHQAPRATIAFVGYPQLFAPGAQHMCNRVAGVPVQQPDRTAAPTFMRKLQAAQQQAASSLGVRFINLNQATNGHGLCGAQPWVNGTLFPRPGLYEHFLFAHPTVEGDAVAARVIANAS
ncbi:MAG: SGNH/GDSL hydrolase family protein [Gordonia sp. (in: high G+C Gram-positive bacteria)]|uniref:SGNH/GDSL hydrolase family protein n=1 Tax=Gordonia sp. (in: high G+C Gram-positive bacteria) TaxID=84139 RepID=UPI003BB76F34